MNKLFLYLIIIGILTLVIVSAWEVFQISSGAKSTGQITVVEITNPVLIPKPLADHLQSDPDYSKFLIDTQTTESTTDTTNTTNTTDTTNTNTNQTAQP